MKKAFEKQDSIVLHLDGTHKSGGRITFILQEDRYRIIIDTALIPSEGEEPPKTEIEIREV